MRLFSRQEIQLHAPQTAPPAGLLIVSEIALALGLKSATPAGTVLGLHFDLADLSQSSHREDASDRNMAVYQ